MSERKEITLVLTADEAEWVRRAVEQLADRYYDSEVVQELSRYVQTNLEMAYVD